MSAALLAQLRRNRIPGDSNDNADTQEKNEGKNVMQEEKEDKQRDGRKQTSDKGENGQKVELTGSAALLARLRRNNAPQTKKQQQDSAGGTATTKATRQSENEMGSISIHVMHGGEMAADVAERLKTRIAEAPFVAGARGVNVDCMSMDAFEACKLETCDNSRRRIVILVVETVENAQPAEEAGKMLRHFNRMRKRYTANGDGERRPLDGAFEFAVLGVGDTNLLMDRQTTSAKDCNQAAQVRSRIHLITSSSVCVLLM